MRRSLLVLLCAFSFIAVGCHHAPPKPAGSSGSNAAAAGAGAETSGAEGANANASGGGAGAGSGEDAAGPQTGLLAKRLIYFDFDSSEIKGEGTDIVAVHAHYLAANPNVHVRLEGHTDDRGSREYNIGLGERRAQAVRRALLLQGASDAQITTVSYGAERPVDAGHDEAAWAKNRRVEIVYLK
ncbi:MAG TPA: peptidoglycan-associated lipoprotein Pal [Steroidobacteraceae bacterium]|nr:peptidoglycan-associated lipoprotein Pal [Steroidobacteraceae bacterium]